MASCTTRYTYAYGYKSRIEAYDRLKDLYASGEVSECEHPSIEYYLNKDGHARYKITLED